MGDDDLERTQDVCLLVSEDSGEEVAFCGPLTIGRHPLNDLEIGHARVSSHHAVIQWNGETWLLRDLGSRNGTTVNGRRVQVPRALATNDRIRIAGQLTWRVQRLSAPRDESGLGATRTVPRKSQPTDIDLHLSFDGTDQGTLRVVTSAGEWSVRTGQRFILLYLLAQARGDWVIDGELKRKLWGRVGAERADPSSFHKLIYDTRQMFQSQGIDGWFIQKQRGRTRLALPADTIHIEGSG